MSALVIFYSRKGENYCNGNIVKLEKGNTEVIADYIVEATGADKFEIETVKSYPTDYLACTEEAKQELSEQARPEVKRFDADLAAYDTIFVGYPNWWGTCPMCVFTYLEHFDLTGKRIVPFCTNEGSGMGSSERDLVRICKGATVERGLAVFGSEVAQARERTTTWARQFV
ncbi:MAG: flavodoxin [Eggerthellaceae bacterium]|jgi:flavodoxin